MAQTLFKIVIKLLLLTLPSLIKYVIRVKTTKQLKLNIESEYSILATNLEIVFMFCMISPYIVAIAGFAILVHLENYKVLFEKYNANVKRYQFGHFPINFLVVSCVLQQILLSLFSLSEFVNSWIVDVMYIVNVWKAS